jgi:hypothetical protein
MARCTPEFNAESVRGEGNDHKPFPQASSRFAPPHRPARAALNGIGLPLLGAFLATGPHVGLATRTVTLVVWGVAAIWLEERTLRLRIDVDDHQLVALRVLTKKHIQRSDLAYIDLDLPTRGTYTRGGGERLVAVLKNGRRITLSFDRTRGVNRHCVHFSELVRQLNDYLGTNTV